MKKYFSLIFKDFIVLKGYLPFIALMIVGLPFLFLTTKTFGAGLSGLAAFSMTYLFALYMTVQSLAYYDSKYKSAQSALNSVPYSRTAIVLSRYSISLLIYAVTLLVYVILSVAVPPLEMLTVPNALIALFIGSLVVGVLQPLIYRFGIEKTRYINAFVAMSVGIGFPFFLKTISGQEIRFDFAGSASPAIVGVIAAVLTLTVLAISVIISIKIYQKKEF